MKQQAIQYLAFDVHRETVVTSLRDASGRVVMRATVATEAGQIVAMVKSAGPRVHMAFEEGTQAQWLQAGSAHSQGAGPELQQPGLGYHEGDAAHQGHLPGAGHSHAGRVGLSGIEAQGMAGYARGRSTRPSGRTAVAAGPAARAATEGQGGHDRRGATAPGLEDPSIDPVPRPCACSTDPGHHAHAVPLPHQAESLAVRRAGGGDAIERRPGVQGRQAAATQNRAPLTRGLNRNHNPILKTVFTGAATSAIAKPGPLREYYEATLARGVKRVWRK